MATRRQPASKAAELHRLTVQLADLQQRVVDIEKLLLLRMFDGTRNTTLPNLLSLIDSRIVTIEKVLNLTITDPDFEVKP